MPELPEVEIVKQSLNKSITGKIIKDILIKNRNLRFKIPKNFEKNISIINSIFEFLDSSRGSKS